MRQVLLLALLTVGGSPQPAADEPKPITPAEAIKQVGKPKVVVEMTVKKAKDRVERRGIIFLDSEDDFHNEKNLCAAVSAEAAARFKGKGISDPATHFAGKTIRIRGCVMVFETRPYLPVHDPDQITIVERKRPGEPVRSPD